jgi:large subunit ribosomal protein L24e
MVIKRQCSFCADEIEPGTGMMFVKRDGSVFHFCTSSCRKQQLHLHRVGHRLKWTRAYTLKRSAEQSHANAAKAAMERAKAAAAAAPPKKGGRAKAKAEPAPEPSPAPSAPAAPPTPPAKTESKPPKDSASTETPAVAPKARKPKAAPTETKT